MNPSIQPYKQFIHLPAPAEPRPSATKFACELGARTMQARIRPRGLQVRQPIGLSGARQISTNKRRCIFYFASSLAIAQTNNDTDRLIC